MPENINPLENIIPDSVIVSKRQWAREMSFLSIVAYCPAWLLSDGLITAYTEVCENFHVERFEKFF